ncbi:MAG: Chitodextrinase precursor [Verrucomicrobia bacterium ADurb.Bin474]|nr:MAG: Chitodextrinase precursor [Verrucomicrobia bacterium ADurb.Bin474]
MMLNLSHFGSAFRMLVLSLLVASPIAAQTSQWMPMNNKDHWSYTGVLKTDTVETPVLLRTEIDSTVYVNGKRTFRTTQKVVPSLSDKLDEISYLNRRYYQTVENGWRVFREENDGKTYEFERSARLLPADFEVGKPYKYKAKLSGGSGSYGLVSYHLDPVGFETVTIPNGTFEALKINVEKRVKLASDEDLEEITAESTEFSSNWYVVDVGMVRQEVQVTSVTSEGSEKLQYTIDLKGTNYLPNHLWPDAVKNNDGWTLVDWLGYITDDHFPWIYHSDHGWLYVDAEDTSDVRLWSESLGWWFTSSDLYPVFYSHDLGEWLTFEGGSKTERRFARQNGTVITASNKGFLTRNRNLAPPDVKVGDDETKDNTQTFLDADGNRYTNTEGGLVVDPGDAPTVEILHPFADAVIRHGEKVFILADAKDKDGIIQWVKIVANGSLLSMQEKPPYQATLDTDTDVTSFSIVAIARDNYGNETTSSPLTIQVEPKETKAPRVRVSSPLNKSYFAEGKKIWIDVVASDSDGFVETVALLVDGIQVGDDATRPPYRFSFIPPVRGNYEISAIAIDDDDVETEAKAITITVNRTGDPDEDLIPETGDGLEFSFPSDSYTESP